MDVLHNDSRYLESRNAPLECHRPFWPDWGTPQAYSETELNQFGLSPGSDGGTRCDFHLFTRHKLEIGYNPSTYPKEVVNAMLLMTSGN